MLFSHLLFGRIHQGRGAVEGVPTSRHPLLRRVPQPHVGADRPAGQDTTTSRLHNVYSGNYRATTILNVNVWGL